MTAFLSSSQDEVLPLFALAPRDGEPVSPFPEVVDPEEHASPVLHRTEFGYDMRIEGARSLPPRAYDHESPWRRFGLFAMIVVILGTVIGAVVSQPAVRNAVFNRGSGSDAPSAAVASTPAATPSPAATPTAAPSPTTSPSEAATPGPTPAPAAAPTPPPAAPAAAAATPVTLHFAGSYSLGPDGTPSTACDSAQSGRGVCTWKITIQPGNPLFANVSWSGGQEISLKILGPDGKPLGVQSGSGGTLSVQVPTPPATVQVVVSVTSGNNAKFDLALANHS